MENSNTSSRHEVFCRFIHKNGKIIYPKNAQFFHFWVDDSSSNDKENGNQFDGKYLN